MANKDCNQALINIYPKINMKDIKKIFDSIPYEYNGVPILTQQQRDLYYKSIEYKYENVFKPIYLKLVNEQLDIKLFFDTLFTLLDTFLYKNTIFCFKCMKFCYNGCRS